MNLRKGGAFPGENAHSNAAPAGKKDRGLPIGTIHNGRQKVSSNPSKWVDVSNGKSYDDHNSQDAQDPHKHVSMEEGHKQILSKLRSELHPDDVHKATGMLANWVQKKTAAKNLQQASNVHSSATNSLSTSHQIIAQKAFDAATKSFNQLSAFIKDSKQRKESDNG